MYQTVTGLPPVTTDKSLFEVDRSLLIILRRKEDRTLRFENPRFFDAYFEFRFVRHRCSCRCRSFFSTTLYKATMIRQGRKNEANEEAMIYTALVNSQYGVSSNRFRPVTIGRAITMEMHQTARIMAITRRFFRCRDCAYSIGLLTAMYLKQNGHPHF